MLKQSQSDVKTLHDPRTGQFTNLRKFIAREQRRQEFIASIVVDVEVKRAPVAAGPVCGWSDNLGDKYAQQYRQRAINWVAV